MSLKQNIKWLLGAVSIALVLSWHASAQVIINEISASNSSILYDEDGDTPDWIELKNISADPVSLAGYYLSDSESNKQKYSLPNITIQPGEFALLFASGKDRVGGTLFWETIIRQGDETKYIIPNSTIGDDWISQEFEDTNWQSGSFGIGYGDSDDETLVPNGTISVFTRNKLIVDDTSLVKKLTLHIDYDDSYVAYLNGVEVSRANITGNSPLAYNHRADSYNEPRLIFGQSLTGINLDNFKTELVEGENTFSIQLHNFNSTSSDLTLIPFLSIGYETEPSSRIGTAPETGLPDEILNNPHTNFRLSSSGETLFLSDPEGTQIDSLTYPELRANESFGRSAIDDELYIFTITTPGRANNFEGYTGRSATPFLSHQGGFYQNDVRISLQDASLGNVTRFTDDGSIPTESSQIFGNNSRLISSTKTLKFRTFEPGEIPSDVAVETYFIDEDHDLPVVTVSTHPDNLWSDESGIYVIGTNGITGFGYYEEGGANWNQDWEIPIHFELFEEDGRKAFGVGAGAKIFGAWSRNNPAKSLSIFFRGEYGTNVLDYQMFDSKEIYEFQALILRNSGNDFSSQGHSMMRDGLMTTLVNETENDIQAYRAAVLYLNGEYWGIHNIREKVNEHYIEANSSASSDNIDLLQGGGEMDFPNGFGPIHGTIENYDELINYVIVSDLRITRMYENVEEMIDIDNYIDYMAAQIYYANTDWPGNNVKLWRSRNADGKWRWILFDTDFGFALSYGGQVWHNTLDFALEPNGSGWPNPPWSTVLFRELAESEIFRDKFANRMADLMNTVFMPANANSVIDSLAGLIESEIPRHMSLSTRSGYWGGSVGQWNSQITTMKNFANNRPSNVENHFTQSIGSGGKFGVGSLSPIEVSVSNTNHGKIQVNRLLIDSQNWQGEYFGGIDIPVTAIPKAGYEFVGWTGDRESTELTIQIRAGDVVHANFTEATNESNIVINEIMYNSLETQDSQDWIELYNPGNSAINLAGWVLKDEDDSHEFILPEGTVIDAENYLVVAQNLTSFTEFYPNIENVIGDSQFGFSGNSDAVRLYNSSSTLIDSLVYDDEVPWPLEADGLGYSLELIDANTDNSVAENWRASTFMFGSPGMENGQSVNNDEYIDQPLNVELYQNYPNPFNPTTNIQFYIPQNSTVKLEVYSIHGKKITTLIDGAMNSGYHQATWDARSFASGLYIARLSIGDSFYTKKMMLIK